MRATLRHSGRSLLTAVPVLVGVCALSLAGFGSRAKAAEREAQSEEASQTEAADPGSDETPEEEAPGGVASESLGLDRLLDSVETPLQPRTWRGRVTLAALSDSNPRLLSDDLADALDLGELEPEAAEASDTAASFQLHLGRQSMDRLELTPERWQWAFSVDAYQSLYRDVEALDLTEIRAAFHLARGGSPVAALSGPLGALRMPAEAHPVSWLVQVGASQVLLNRDAYLETLEASASILLPHGESRFATQFLVHLRDETFDREPAVGRRSGAEVRLTAREYVLLGRPDRLVRFELSGGRRSGGDPWQRWLGEAEVGFSWTFSDRWALAATGAVRWDDFDHRASDLFNPELILFDPEFDLVGETNPAARRREDIRLHGSLALSWRVWRKLSLVARAGFTDRDSNLESPPLEADLDYRRTLASLGMTWSF